jgi:hypothetical protein
MKLRLKFPSAIAVVKGEIALDDAERYEPRRWESGDDQEGPHGLVPARTCAEICGRASSSSGHRVVLAAGFPPPALVVDRQRFWARADVEAYARGEVVPERGFNYLRDTYLTLLEVAALSGLDRTVVYGYRSTPKPAAIIGRRRLYLRSEVEIALPEIKSEAWHRPSYAIESPRAEA